MFAMKVIQIIARMNQGGTSRWIENLVIGLRKNGHTVILLSGNVESNEIEDPIFTELGGKRVEGLGRSVSLVGDLKSISKIRNVIKNVGKDKTVFLSTHIMQEVEAICDRVIIIDQGKIVTDKKLDKLVAEEKEQIIEVEFDKAITNETLATLANLKTYQNNGDNLWLLTFNTEEDMRPNIFDFAQANGLKTLQISLNSILREYG
jgi:hypothetical protein